jgi:hypothetical protein
MKIKDITQWSERWSTPLGTMDPHAAVADGVFVELSLWGTPIIGLAVPCPDGKYFGSIRAPGPVYDHVLEFLKRNYGRKLREVMDAEIDISDAGTAQPRRQINLNAPRFRHQRYLSFSADDCPLLGRYRIIQFFALQFLTHRFSPSVCKVDSIHSSTPKYSSG